MPEPNKYNWIPIYPPDGKYTIMPLKIQKLAGRDPETGRVVVRTLGGGNKKYFRWIDYNKTPLDDGSVREEKVFNIRYDPLRSSKLALVGGGLN
jgi:large subunit ribosomal protein L2